MAPTLAVSTTAEFPGSRGCRWRRRRRELKSSNSVLADRGGREVCEGHRLRYVGPIMNPVRRPSGYVHRPPRPQSERVHLLWERLDPTVGTVPIPVDLVSAHGVVLIAPDAQGSRPSDLHQEASAQCRSEPA